MNARRVDLRRRTRVVADRYCPRCLTPTDRRGLPPGLRRVCLLTGLRISARWCDWCGWKGWRLH